MSRFLIFIYGLITYLIGMMGLVWFILFVGEWDFLPHLIDSDSSGTLASAILINLGLIALFGLQHTVMARPAFKAYWIKIVPAPAERSTYVLLSGGILMLICFYWQPIDGYLWQAENEIVKIILIAGFATGWLISGVATFLINHFELFGLQQVYYHLLEKKEPTPQFAERLFYKIVRHPVQLGVMIGIWFTPAMSMSHLMLSVSMSIYIIIGLYFEEKDLVATLGQDYKDYQGRVRMLAPLPK